MNTLCGLSVGQLVISGILGVCLWCALCFAWGFGTELGHRVSERWTKK